MTRDEQTIEEPAANEEDNTNAIIMTFCLWGFGLLTVFALYAAGRFLLGDSLTYFRLWREQPHVTVEAKCVNIESWLDKNSSSGLCYRGEYLWEYQGSEGTILRKKKYEERGLVPESVDVTLYLGTDDAWHKLGDNGGGLFDSLLDMVAGGAVMLVAALLAVLIVRSMAKKVLKALPGRST